MSWLPTVLNLLALTVSFAALGVSSVISVKQTRLSHRANQLPVIVGLLAEMRSYEFTSKEESLWQELPEVDPATPISELPRPLREQAISIGNFYSMIAYLATVQTIDDRLAALALHHRAIRTWD